MSDHNLPKQIRGKKRNTHLPQPLKVSYRLKQRIVRKLLEKLVLSDINAIHLPFVGALVGRNFDSAIEYITSHRDIAPVLKNVEDLLNDRVIKHARIAARRIIKKELDAIEKAMKENNVAVLQNGEINTRRFL